MKLEIEFEGIKPKDGEFVSYDEVKLGMEIEKLENTLSEKRNTKEKLKKSIEHAGEYISKYQRLLDILDFYIDNKEKIFNSHEDFKTELNKFLQYKEITILLQDEELTITENTNIFSILKFVLLSVLTKSDDYRVVGGKSKKTKRTTKKRKTNRRNTKKRKLK